MAECPEQSSRGTGDSAVGLGKIIPCKAHKNPHCAWQALKPQRRQPGGAGPHVCRQLGFGTVKSKIDERPERQRLG